MSRHTTKPIKLTYSHPIKQRKEYVKDVYKDKIFQPKVNDGGVLEKTIHSYRMWFLFLKLGLELEEQRTELVMKESVRLGNGTKTKRVTHKIRIDSSKYRDWDLDQVLHLSFDDWWKDHRHLFIEEQVQRLNSSEKIDSDYLYLKIPRDRKELDLVREIKHQMKNTIISPPVRFSQRGRPQPIN